MFTPFLLSNLSDSDKYFKAETKDVLKLTFPSFTVKLYLEVNIAFAYGSVSKFVAYPIVECRNCFKVWNST